METRKSLKFIIIFTLAIFISPVFCYGYGNEKTHPALTNETIDIFDYYYDDLKLNEEERNFISEGSKEEDEPETRCLNHFYDPIYDRGLTEGISIGVSAKNWSQNTRIQAGFSNLAGIGVVKSLFSSDSDYSWDRAIYDYVYGDKSRAMKSLGHILHLIQDMSVPPHVRNDQHMTDPSYYETFTKDFDKEKISNLSDILIDENKRPILESSLDNYFYKLAKFTNENFFSRSTLFDKKYNSPVTVKNKKEILTNGDVVWFDYIDVNNESVKLIGLKKTYDQKSNILYKDYFIDDWDNLILTDYWNILSKQAVLHGAGVMKLFFDEVEREKETLALFNKNKSFLAKIGGKIAGIFSGGSKNGVDSADNNLASAAGSIGGESRGDESISRVTINTNEELIGENNSEIGNENNENNQNNQELGGNIGTVDKAVDNLVDNFGEEEN